LLACIAAFRIGEVAADPGRIDEGQALRHIPDPNREFGMAFGQASQNPIGRPPSDRALLAAAGTDAQNAQSDGVRMAFMTSSPIGRRRYGILEAILVGSSTGINMAT
jgi:hypothetical protein